MKTLTAAWCAALFLGALAPASAQWAPIYRVEGQAQRCSLCYPIATPATPELIAKQTAAEDPAVTNVAKGLYATLARASFTGYRLTPELQQLWTPALETKAAAQLATFGTPAWSFVGNGWTSAGQVSVYRLAFENAHPVFMSVGVSNNGVVYDLRLADSVAAAAPAP